MNHDSDQTRDGLMQPWLQTTDLRKGIVMIEGFSRREAASVDVIETKEKIWDALKQVIDPELGINIVDLGLVYNVEVWPEGRAEVKMTMTTRACPLSGHLKAATEGAVYLAVPDLTTEIVVVWEPPWSPAMISPEGRMQLGR